MRRALRNETTHVSSASAKVSVQRHMAIQVDQLLKKNFWIVILPMIGIAALLNAQAVTQLVGISLGPDEKALATPPAVGKVAPAPASARNTSAQPIVDRNPFDHVTDPLKPPPIEDPTAVANTGPKPR